MTSKTIVKMIIVIFAFFIFISAFNLSNNPVLGQKCENDTATNNAIVNSLYEKIKGNKDLAPQISHINISSTNLAIKIQGWADSKKDYDKIIEYALKTDCARVVNVNNFNEEKPKSIAKGQGCAPGTKQCGDICIPDNDVCNIK